MYAPSIAMATTSSKTGRWKRWTEEEVLKIEPPSFPLRNQFAVFITFSHTTTTSHTMRFAILPLIACAAAQQLTDVAAAVSSLGPAAQSLVGQYASQTTNIGALLSAVPTAAAASLISQYQSAIPTGSELSSLISQVPAQYSSNVAALTSALAASNLAGVLSAIPSGILPSGLLSPPTGASSAIAASQNAASSLGLSPVVGLSLVLGWMVLGAAMVM